MNLQQGQDVNSNSNEKGMVMVMEGQVQSAPAQAAMNATADYDVNKWNEMTDEERQQVLDIASKIDISDSQGIIQYGSLAQSDISKFSDSMLDQIRAKDSGEVGEVLTDLLVKVQDVDIDALDPNQKASQSFSEALNGKPINS
jgi:uncharacterized protein YaaN involved in tellurite resistance